jgi:NADH-quinone oxidoreductase subunit L
MSGNYFYFALGLIAAFMTAFYIFRLIYLTFYSNQRYDAEHVHPHESPKTMTIPLIILAVLSVIGGFIGLPAIIGPSAIGSFLDPVFENAKSMIVEPHLGASTEIILLVVSILVALISIYIAFKDYAKEYKPSKFSQSTFYRIVQNKYYVDEFYNAVIVMPLRKLSDLFYSFMDLKIIDGAVNGTAKFFTGLSADWRRLQTGVLQDYAIISIAGIILILAYVLLM